MKTALTVDGKGIPLNAFTQEIVGHVTIAMAESLRGVDKSWKEIAIKVENDSN